MRTEFGKHAKTTALFASFMFLQYVILRMGNGAGKNYLPNEVQEKVYLFLQIFAIAGFLSFALFDALAKSARVRKVVSVVLLALWAPCAGYIFFAPRDSAAYLIITAAAVTLLGFAGGKVYRRMAALTASGVRTGVCMGLGCGTALLAQYFFQLEFSLPIPLGVCMLAAFACLAYIFWRAPGEDRAQSGESARSGESAQSDGDRGKKRVLRFILTVVIASAMLLFIGYFNSYIHHLQIASDYTEYNVYTWPRLLMAAGLVLFGLIGDIKNGRFLPLCVLCTVIVGLLNSVLVGRNGAYTLNMCLYYIALSAVVAYYNLTFWRAAANSRYPAFTASLGRVLDSAGVIFCLLLGLQSWSAVAVLVLNIVSLVVVIVAMALSGDFQFAADKREEPTPLSSDEAFNELQKRYDLSSSELKVVRELVLTEDKQAVISDRLDIKMRTVQANITAIYRKTGVSTRSGLVRLYEDLIK